MRIIPLLPHTVTIYQSIQELPERRHQEFQYYLLQETGIGSTVTAVEQHFERLASFITHNMQQEAADELANLHYNFSFALERFSPASLAFGCLVAAVDEVATDDLSEEGLQQLVTRLSTYGLSAGHVEELNSFVKKK